MMRDEDLARLDLILWCPTQFQEFVCGTNVRVHTIDEEVYASAIITRQSVTGTPTVTVTRYKYMKLLYRGNSHNAA